MVHPIQNEVGDVEVDADTRHLDGVEEARQFVAGFLSCFQRDRGSPRCGIAGDGRHGVQHPPVGRVAGVLRQHAHVKGDDLHAERGREVDALARIGQPRVEEMRRSKANGGFDGIQIAIAFAVEYDHDRGRPHGRRLHSSAEFLRAFRRVKPIGQPADLDQVEPQRLDCRERFGRFVAPRRTQEHANLIAHGSLLRLTLSAGTPTRDWGKRCEHPCNHDEISLVCHQGLPSMNEANGPARYLSAGRAGGPSRGWTPWHARQYVTTEALSRR